MERKEDRELLRRNGFAEREVERLSKIRANRAEEEKHRYLEHHRRLEFARWLVVKGKLSEQIA